MVKLVSAGPVFFTCLMTRPIIPTTLQVLECRVQPKRFRREFGNKNLTNASWQYENLCLVNILLLIRVTQGPDFVSSSKHLRRWQLLLCVDVWPKIFLSSNIKVVIFCSRVHKWKYRVNKLYNRLNIFVTCPSNYLLINMRPLLGTPDYKSASGTAFLLLLYLLFNFCCLNSH